MNKVRAALKKVGDWLDVPVVEITLDREVVITIGLFVLAVVHFVATHVTFNVTTVVL